MRNIHIIACGGTIAGRADRATNLTGYTAGVMDIGDLLAAVPAIHDVAAVTGEQLFNIDSSDMTEEKWLALARRTEDAAARDDVDGIVVTHGTDTLEETAYFLNLTVHTCKPVILTGAMRPASALSADGPLNLLEAVQAAKTAEAGKYGVLIAMNGMLCSARFGYKTDTTHVHAFRAVKWVSSALSKTASLFSISSLCVCTRTNRLFSLATRKRCRPFGFCTLT